MTSSTTATTAPKPASRTLINSSTSPPRTRLAHNSSLKSYSIHLPVTPTARPVATEDDDHLVLSTVHSTKAGEWDIVHVIHATDGMFPSSMAMDDRDQLEEERRLFYVAVTRARNDLYIYFPMEYAGAQCRARRLPLLRTAHTVSAAPHAAALRSAHASNCEHHIVTASRRKRNQSTRL